MLRICFGVGMLGLMLSGTVGCSSAVAESLPETVDVTGTITLDGQPLASATITFLPKGETRGIECVGSTDESGDYTLTQIRGKEGAPPGQYTVVVNRYVQANGTPVMLDGPEPPANLGAVESLPQHYSSGGDSILTATVPEGGGTINFDLASR